MTTNEVVQIFETGALLIILLLLAIGIWSEMTDDRRDPPYFPPSDEDEIRKYLNGKIKTGGENVQKKKEKEDSQPAQGSPRADD